MELKLAASLFVCFFSWTIPFIVSILAHFPNWNLFLHSKWTEVLFEYFAGRLCRPILLFQYNTGSIWCSHFVIWKKMKYHFVTRENIFFCIHLLFFPLSVVVIVTFTYIEFTWNQKRIYLYCRKICHRFICAPTVCLISSVTICKICKYFICVKHMFIFFWLQKVWPNQL